jgi:hypothetical protein
MKITLLQLSLIEPNNLTTPELRRTGATNACMPVIVSYYTHNLVLFYKKKTSKQISLYTATPALYIVGSI